MNIKWLKKKRKELCCFIEEFKDLLGRSERLHWCQLYLYGLLMEGERKSIQPMAARLPGGNEQAMQQFVNQSPWHHESIQRRLIQCLTKKFSSSRGVLVLDDTSFPKKGQYSVGVSRQYCGVLGKVENCQSLVTWHYVSREGKHFPLLAELYLPETWTQSPERLRSVGVPERRFKFKKKWELAHELLDQLPPEVGYEAIVCDAGYGEIREFLSGLDNRNQTFIAQIPESHSFWPVEVEVKTKVYPRGRPRQYEVVADKALKPLSAKKWRMLLEAQTMSWKKVKLPLVSKRYTQVMAIRVREVISQAFYRPGVERWLLVEKLSDGNYKYFVCNASENISLRKMIRWSHERWKIEQGYQRLKEELGLDHFEGRSWRGLHHHITLCFMAYAFLLFMQKGSFKKKRFI